MIYRQSEGRKLPVRGWLIGHKGDEKDCPLCTLLKSEGYKAYGHPKKKSKRMIQI